MAEITTFPIALVITIVGAALGLWWRIEARIAAERQERSAAIMRVFQVIDGLNDKFNEFQIEATKNFVPVSYQSKMEDRFLASVDRLATRLETVITRMEGMANQVARMSNEVSKVSTAVEKNGH